MFHKFLMCVTLFSVIMLSLGLSNIDRGQMVANSFNGIKDKFFQKASSQKIADTFFDFCDDGSFYPTTYNLVAVKTEGDEIVNVYVKKQTWHKEEKMYEYHIEGIRKEGGRFVHYLEAERIFLNVKVRIVEPSGQTYETVKKERLEPKRIWNEAVFNLFGEGGNCVGMK